MKRVSYSQYKTWVECPYRWKLKYIDGLDYNVVNNIENADFILGTTPSFGLTTLDYVPILEKAIRRDITNYGRLSERARKKAVTKLLFAARAKLRNSDIIEHLERLAIDKDLETGLIRDREPKISKPDIGGLTGRDLAMYRYLTGTKNKDFKKLCVIKASLA